MGFVVSLPQLLAEVETLRQAGKKIVTTNGCFDLLHIGHLRYLQAAKALGDVLIVAVNADASVRGLKGDLRPVVSEADRAELIAGLACVDFAIIFRGETPIPELQAIKPNVHVKGGQYTVETLPEAPVLQSIGCEIAFIEMVDNRSTSQLIEKIIRAYS
ncbi:MAG: adenylyltransferase/cytidyltransferase family protein [Vampirovibrio sp.]|nr:adenylyltransferase/cytidyltransferase family protein [Vampirovibrio sp.]